MSTKKMTQTQEFFVALRELHRLPFRWRHARDLFDAIFRSHSREGTDGTWYTSNGEYTLSLLLSNLVKIGMLGKLERGIYHVTLAGRKAPVETIKPWKFTPPRLRWDDQARRYI